MTVLSILNLILFGFAVGFLGTYIGAGGGFLHVPTLLYMYNFSPQTAIGTSLTVVFMNAISGSISYGFQKRIDYSTGLKLAFATIPGAILGAYITKYFTFNVFTIIFGSVLIFFSVILLARPFLVKFKMMGGKVEQGKKKLAGKDVSTFFKVNKILVDKEGIKYYYSFDLKLGFIISILIGIISSLLGIGGGIIHVPALIIMLNFPVHIATATSHFILAITALSGAGYHYYLGNVVLWAALAMGFGTVFGAQIGAIFSKKSKESYITLILAGILLLIGFQMMNKGLTGQGNPKVKIPESLSHKSLSSSQAVRNPDSPTLSEGQPVVQNNNIITELPIIMDNMPSVRVPSGTKIPTRMPNVLSPGVTQNAVTSASPKFMPGEKMIGADIMDINPVIIKTFGLHNVHGVLVNGIEKNSPADESGLQRSDIITRINGRRVVNVFTIEKEIKNSSLGDQLELTIIRKQKRYTIFIKVGKKPEQMLSKQVEMAKDRGIHLLYTIGILGGVFLLLFQGWFEKTFIMIIGAVLLTYIGFRHGFYGINEIFKSIYWDTLGLLLGLNIFSAVFNEAGLFSYIAKRITIVSKGQKIRIFIFICTSTYIISCFANNLSTILVMVPIVLMLSKSIGFDPRPYIVGVVIASNIGGASTMIGDFPNMIISSQADIPFIAFIKFMLPINILLLVIAFIYIIKKSKKEKLSKIEIIEHEDNPDIVELLNDYRKQLPEVIKNPTGLKRGLFLFFIVLIGFIFCEKISFPPSIIAIIGGVICLFVSKMNIKTVLKKLQIRDLLFFLSLFILVGAVNTTGILYMVSEKMTRWSGDNSLILNLFLIWTAAIVTCFCNAGPTTALFIPIVKSFSLNVPQYLYWWSLSLGVCAGSCATLTGATAGPVSSTMLDSYLKKTNSFNKVNRLNFRYYLKYGLGFMLIYLLVSSLYVMFLYRF